MRARRDVKHAKTNEDDRASKDARQRVNLVKIALGERGEVWWNDGSPDYNQRLVDHTPYAEWYERLNRKAPREAR